MTKKSPYKASDIFFDPWISLSYFYTIIPILPLIFDRIFIYYPSDRWAEETLQSPAAAARYRWNLIRWIEDGIIVPVVKGRYPIENEIGKERQERDGPTEEFRNNLQCLRSKSEEEWIILEPGATERGRESASRTIKNIGEEKQLISALRLDIDPKAVPELAFYYAGGQKASTDKTLLEAIGTYENDDWIRKQFQLGDYLLPSTMAYQYRALRDLIQEREFDEIYHNSVAAQAIDTYAERRQIRIGLEWPERDQVKQWRELGLHRVVKEYLASEARSPNRPVENADEKGITLGAQLANFRSQLSVDIASSLLDNNLLLDVLGCLGGTVTGYVSSGPLGAVAGSVGGTVVGRVGSRSIRFGLRRIHWDSLIDSVSGALCPQLSRGLKRFAVGFGDVTVFGNSP